MLKRPIEGTKGPAETALLMITQQHMENISQLDRLPPAWIEWLDWRTVLSLLACGRNTAWGSTWSSRIRASMDRPRQGVTSAGQTFDRAHVAALFSLQTAMLMITQQQMEDTSQLDRLPLDWLQWLDRRSVWSLFVCGRTTALSAGFLAFTGRMYLQH